MKKYDRSNENGRSMIEMLGVLAIIGVLSVGGIAGYSKAMHKYRVNKAIEQITLIAGNARTFFATQGNYDGFTSYDNTGKAIIKKAKLVPDEMLTLDADGKITDITGVFGYRVNIPRLVSGFSIKYFIGDDEEACIELLTYDWTASNVKAIMMEIYEVSSNYNFRSIPIPFDKAVDTCSEIFTFLRSYDSSEELPGIDLFFDVDVSNMNTSWAD